MSGNASLQRVVTLALEVLNIAAYGSATQPVDTAEIRPALAPLWCVLRDRRHHRACYEWASLT